MHFTCLVPFVNSTKDWNEKGIKSEDHRKNYSMIQLLKSSEQPH